MQIFIVAVYSNFNKNVYWEKFILDQCSEFFLRQFVSLVSLFITMINFYKESFGYFIKYYLKWKVFLAGVYVLGFHDKTVQARIS